MSYPCNVSACIKVQIGEFMISHSFCIIFQVSQIFVNPQSGKSTNTLQILLKLSILSSLIIHEIELWTIFLMFYLQEITPIFHDKKRQNYQIQLRFFNRKTLIKHFERMVDQGTGTQYVRGTSTPGPLRVQLGDRDKEIDLISALLDGPKK